MRTSILLTLLSAILLSTLSFTFNKKIAPPIEVKITGIITDGSDPLIGASVVEQGTTNGTISDIDGIFHLTVSSQNANIVVSYTGFESQTIRLSKRDLSKKIQVAMAHGAQLEECVVIGHDTNNRSKIRKLISGKKRKAEMKSSQAPVNYGRTLPPAANELMNHNEDFEMEAGNYTTIKENEFFNSSKTPLSTLSIDVDRASYSNVRRFLQQGSLPPVDAVRIEEMVNYFNYDYEAPSIKAKRPFSTNSTLTNCPWNREHQLLHVSLQGAKMDREEIPASNFVFLIDVSGSMGSENKLPLLKSSFKLFVEQLSEKDRVAIVVYAGAAGLVLESTPGSEKVKIIESLDNLQSGGSTAGAAGIQQAYKIANKNFIKGGNNRIILATDGDFNVGTSGDESLVKLIEEKRKSGTYLSILGFGVGNYQEGKMQKIADAGNGNHSYIDNMQEAKKVLMDEFGGTMFTIAKDVKIQIEFNPAAVESYRMVGYENRVLAAEDFNDDTKDAGEMGAGHSVTVIYEIIPVGSKSSFSKIIDPLKYQKEIKALSPHSKELATIKYRFKKSDAMRSTKSEEIIYNKLTPWKKLDSDIKWAANVAEFGMILRGSNYAVDTNYGQLLSSIKSNEKAQNKYRSEFIDLVEIAKALDTRTAGVE
ncbi:von Willebrand factor type A domain-containing protein [Saprospiraceae bacterium]|nr:von Willebrand factor type A domain-containing protein [Saprospiraceae bacterium]